MRDHLSESCTGESGTAPALAAHRAAARLDESRWSPAETCVNRPPRGELCFGGSMLAGVRGIDIDVPAVLRYPQSRFPSSK
jgi:hypothetical protein